MFIERYRCCSCKSSNIGAVIKGAVLAKIYTSKYRVNNVGEVVGMLDIQSISDWRCLDCGSPAELLRERSRVEEARDE